MNKAVLYGELMKTMPTTFEQTHTYSNSGRMCDGVGGLSRLNHMLNGFESPPCRRNPLLKYPIQLVLNRNPINHGNYVGQSWWVFD